MYCSSKRNRKNCACSQEIHKTEIFDELEADNSGFDITSDDITNDEEVGEDTYEDDDADHEHLNMMGNQVDAGGITGR